MAEEHLMPYQILWEYSAPVPIQNSVKGFFEKSSFKFELLKSSANFS